MTVLPPGPRPTPEAVAASRPAPLQRTLRMMVFGFSPAERELILGVVALTQRRSQRLELVDSDDMSSIEVILLDGEDEQTMRWVAGGGLPDGKTVIQVDGRKAPSICNGPSHGPICLRCCVRRRTRTPRSARASP